MAGRVRCVKKKDLQDGRTGRPRLRLGTSRREPNRFVNFRMSRSTSVLRVFSYPGSLPVHISPGCAFLPERSGFDPFLNRRTAVQPNSLCPLGSASSLVGCPLSVVSFTLALPSASCYLPAPAAPRVAGCPL